MWQCGIDDPRFDNINPAQWRWYAHMFLAEEEQEFRRNLDLVEYLASFWNSEAVRTIKKNRDRKENQVVDEKLKHEIISGNYKEDPLLKAIQKMRENANLKSTDIDTPEIKRVKAPVDLDKIAKTSRI